MSDDSDNKSCIVNIAFDFVVDVFVDIVAAIFRFFH